MRAQDCVRSLRAVNLLTCSGQRETTVSATSALMWLSLILQTCLGKINPGFISSAAGRSWLHGSKCVGWFKTSLLCKDWLVVVHCFVLYWRLNHCSFSPLLVKTLLCRAEHLVSEEEETWWFITGFEAHCLLHMSSSSQLALTLISTVIIWGRQLWCHLFSQLSNCTVTLLAYHLHPFSITT